MKFFRWLLIAVFFVFSVSGQVVAADNTRIAWSNTDWGNTDWRNTGWSNTDWGNTDWGDTGWGNDVQSTQGEKPEGQLMKVTLGIKKPDGFCAMVVTWAKSSVEAISAVAQNCQDCIINNLMNSDSTGAVPEDAERFCQ